MKCQACGYDNRDEARYCVQCGSPLERLPERKAGARGWLVAIAVLSATVIALSVAILTRKSPTLGYESSSDYASLSSDYATDGEALSESSSAGNEEASEKSVNKETSSDSDTNPSPKPEQEITWEDPRQLVIAFIHAWYDDWSLDGTGRRDNEESVQERCRSMVDESSELYEQLVGTGLGKAAYSTRTDASTCLVEEPTLVGEDGNTYRVSVRYTSDAESNWSGSSYDWLVQSRVHEVSWDVTTDDKGTKVVGLALVPRGSYTLAGTVRVHEEDTGSQRISVVSMTLDEPVHFEDEYKGTYEVDAREVMLSNSQSDAYDEWAQYDGRHIVVECDGLKGAYHTASSYNVDALATGDIRLVEADEPSVPDPEPSTTNTVSLDGCDLIIPDAWVGKVEQGDHYGDVTLDWDGLHMLSMRQCSPDKFLTYNPELESFQMESGATVTIRKGSDFTFEAEVPYDQGKGLILYLTAYNDNLPMFFNASEDKCREYFALQAAAAGCSTDEDPEQVAIACLKVCVSNLRM